MNESFYQFYLAIVLTYCTFTADNRVSRMFLALCAACWWIIALGEIGIRIG